MSYKEKFDDCKNLLRQFSGLTAICYVGNNNSALSMRSVFNHYKIVDHDGVGIELKKSSDDILFIPMRDADVSIHGKHISISYSSTGDRIGITIVS